MRRIGVEAGGNASPLASGTAVLRRRNHICRSGLTDFTRTTPQQRRKTISFVLRNFFETDNFAESII
jgi:hypothetical protein